eukprot:15335063-Ditylum_brightwellii.AAC.2
MEGADLMEGQLRVMVAEYARAQGITNEPSFIWWVSCTLRKCDIILSAARARLRKTTHKYGINIPTCLLHDHAIDTNTATPSGKMS